MGSGFLENIERSRSVSGFGGDFQIILRADERGKSGTDDGMVFDDQYPLFQNAELCIATKARTTSGSHQPFFVSASRISRAAGIVSAAL